MLIDMASTSRAMSDKFVAIAVNFSDIERMVVWEAESIAERKRVSP